MNGLALILDRLGNSIAQMEAALIEAAHVEVALSEARQQIAFHEATIAALNEEIAILKRDEVGEDVRS